MLKVLLLFVGLLGGSAGATAWLLSEPAPATQPRRPIPTNAETWQQRLQVLKGHFQVAMDEGRRSGQYSEEHLQRRLDAYRKGSRDRSS